MLNDLNSFFNKKVMMTLVQSSTSLSGIHTQQDHPKNKVFNNFIVSREIFKFIDSIEAHRLSSVSRNWKQLIDDAKSILFLLKIKSILFTGVCKIFHLLITI